jgi:ribokinase
LARPLPRELTGVADIVVAGQIARDLVLVVDELPEPGSSAAVRQRRELLGGKGANQAVGLAQLGLRPALLGVVGDDRAGGGLLAQAGRDGIDVSAVVRRAGAATGLITDLVDRHGRWRYLEDLPPPVLLTEADVRAAVGLIRRARWVSIQLQQPAPAVLAAARLAREEGCRVVLDGAPADANATGPLLAAAEVVRADARETGLLTGARLDSPAAALRTAASLLERGPSLVALAAGRAGNAFAWPGGELFLPLTDTPVADTTGAGDAFVAGLVAGLDRGDPPQEAARLAVAAAGATVGYPGGRPDLSPEALAPQLAQLAARG